MKRRIRFWVLLLLVLTYTSCEDCCMCDPCLFSGASNSNTSATCDKTIGAADGTKCTVISKTETSKADAVRCGFNDIGAPNIAIYEVERRQCTKYNNGKIESSYQDTSERFVRCHQP